MNKVRFVKSALCFILVCVVAFATSLPTYAVDLNFMDEHGEEGKELWEAYKNEVISLDIAHNQDVIERINVSAERYYARCYEEITGKPQEEYNSISANDKLLLSSTFLEPYYINSLGQTYNNDTEWSNATSTFDLFFGVYYDDNKNIELLYDNLMYWQYQYYQSSGAFYNFMEEKDTLDYINDKYLEDYHAETKDNAESKVTSSKDTSSISDDDEKKEKGIWDDFFANLKAHIFTIVLLCAFLIATAVILIRKKRVNIQNNDNNNNI